MEPGFPFASAPDQLAVLDALERVQPAAVVAVTATRVPPVFEDGDLAFPSITVPAEAGARLGDGLDVGVVLDDGRVVSLGPFQ